MLPLSPWRKAFFLTLFGTPPVLCALGAAVANRQFVQNVLLECPLQLGVAFLVMALYGETMKGLLQAPIQRNPFIGGLFGLSVLLVGTLSGATASLLLCRSLDLGPYLLVPLFWIGTVGGIPAFLIGMLFTLLLRRLSLHPSHP